LYKTKTILFKHYLFGLLGVTFGFLLIGEFPSWFTIKRDWIQWIITIASIPLIGIFIAKRIDKRLKLTGKKINLFSAFMIFLTWVLILYSKAFAMGLIDTIGSGSEKILESIVGYTIYQLWIYVGLGVIHGILGGFFLANELKKIRKHSNKSNPHHPQSNEQSQV